MLPLTLEERFAQLQSSLIEWEDAALLNRHVSAWALPIDRHLPQALLTRPLREILAFSYEQLAKTPGIGNRKIAKLIEVLERVGRPRSWPTPSLDHQNQRSVEEAAEPRPELASPENLTDPMWHEWCDLIRSHRLERETLGRFAVSLRDLPGAFWSVPLSEYADRQLSEIRSIPGLGRARTNQILEVFSGVVQTIKSHSLLAPLAIRLMPFAVRDAMLWVEAVFRETSIPDARAIRERLLTPLFTMLDADLDSDTAAVILGRRIGLNGPAEKLIQIGTGVGLTCERVRQLAAFAAQAIRVRWPEGRYVLENLYHYLLSAPACDEQVDLLQTVLEGCFGLQLNRAISRTDVIAAWERAGRAKRTPMSDAGVRLWAIEEFPIHHPDLIRHCLEKEGFRHTNLNGDAIFISNDPLDKLFLHLEARPEPVRIDELPDFFDGNNPKIGKRSDPRFIEDEHGRVLLAERCSFIRRDGRWFLGLDPIHRSKLERRADSISLNELIHLIVGGLMQAGICDATAWGIHRFTNAMLQKLYAASLPHAVTPFVLATTLTRHSNGMVRTMRRRRLRWDSADGSIPVRGKRGWINRVVNVAAVPMTFDELDVALRVWFQDYELHSLKQFYLGDEEEGESNYGCQFVPGVNKEIPGLIVPHEWEFDLAKMNISEGVLRLVAKIISKSSRSPFPKSYLRRLPWMVRLCEHIANGTMRWDHGNNGLS